MLDKGFYIWNVEKSKGKLAFMLMLVVVIVIAFLLFNIWPLWLKIALWYCSFYLLMFLVILKIPLLNTYHLYIFIVGIDYI